MLLKCSGMEQQSQFEIGIETSEITVCMNALLARGRLWKPAMNRAGVFQEVSGSWCFILQPLGLFAHTGRSVLAGSVRAEATGSTQEQPRKVLRMEGCGASIVMDG